MKRTRKRGACISKYFQDKHEDLDARGPSTPVARETKRKRRSRRNATPLQEDWIPPASVYGLIEEQLYEDPWKLLVACMLLNKTSSKQVRDVIWKLFQIIPDATTASMIDERAIEDVIRPLGLFRKRSRAIKKFSKEFLEKDWKTPEELYGIGKYGADAYAIFCVPDAWREVNPEDKDLRLYLQFLKDTDGLGCGFEREPIPDA